MLSVNGDTVLMESMLTLFLLAATVSADGLGNQFGPRSGPTERRS